MFLDAAEALVREGGPSALTARSVAQAVGYAPGSLYVVFRNLDDLMVAVSGRTLERLYEALQSSGAGTDTGVERLKAFAHTYIAFAAAEPHLWRMVFEHRLPEGEPTPDWLPARIAQSFELVERALSPVLPADAPQAMIRNAARALWSGVHGIAALAQTGKLDDVTLAGAESTTIADLLVESILAGLVARQGTGTVA